MSPSSENGRLLGLFKDWVESGADLEHVPDGIDLVECMLAAQNSVEELSLKIKRALSRGACPEGYRMGEVQFWKWMMRVKNWRDSKRFLLHRLRKNLGIDLMTLRDRLQDAEDDLDDLIEDEDPERVSRLAEQLRESEAKVAKLTRKLSERRLVTDPDLQLKNERICSLERVICEKNKRIAVLAELAGLKGITGHLKKNEGHMVRRLAELEAHKKPIFEALYKIYSHGGYASAKEIRTIILEAVPDMDRVLEKRLAKLEA